MLQPLFLLFFGDLPVDDSLMSLLEVPHIPIPLLPLLCDSLQHALQLMFPRLPLLPVYGLQKP